MTTSNLLDQNLLLIIDGNQDDYIIDTVNYWASQGYKYKKFNLKDQDQIIQTLKETVYSSILINLNNRPNFIFNFISTIKKITASPIIILANKDEKDSLFDPLYQEIYLFIEKPFKPALLFLTIRNAHQVYQLKEKITTLFNSLVESNKKIEEGNKQLREIEDKIDLLLSLR
ncbi:MAG: hypothetical protein ABIG09_01340 [bacterium]